MFKYFLRGIVKDLLPVVHNHNPVNIAGHILHTVGDKENGKAVPAVQPLNLIQDLIPALGIQTGRRLIQYHHLRPHRKDSRYRHPSFLPARQFKWRLFIEALIHSHQIQGMARPLLGLFLRTAQVLRSKADIGKYISFKKLMLRVLKYKTDLAAQLLHLITVAVYAGPVIQDISARRPDQAVQVLD